MPIDFSKKENNILHPQRYNLEQVVANILKKNPREIAHILVESHLKLHDKFTVSIKDAIEYIDEVKKEVGSNLLGAFIFGGVARGLKGDKPPKDIDILLIVKDGTKVKTKGSPDISEMIYRESMTNFESLLKENQEGAFLRITLSLPILILEGEEYIRKLRKFSQDHLRVLDVYQFLVSQRCKRVDEYKTIKGIDKNRELTKEEKKELTIMTANEIKLSEVIKDLILSEKFNNEIHEKQRKNEDDLEMRIMKTIEK